MERIAAPINQKMKNKRVAALHEALKALGAEIEQSEVAKSFYGETTAAFIVKMQNEFGLEASGNVDEKTASVLNKALEEKGLFETSPPVTPKPKTITITGRVTNANGQPVETEVILYRAAFRVEEKLADTKTNADGRYSVVLEPNPKNGPLNVLARAKVDGGKAIASDIAFDVTKSAALDITAASRPIPAKSVFEALEAQVRPAIGNTPLASLREMEAQTDFTFLARDRKVDAEMLSRRVMSERIGQNEKISAEIIFAFVAQSEPTSLPASTVGATPTQAFADDLDVRVLGGIVNIPEKTQRRILEKAIKRDLVPFDTQNDVDKAISDLAKLRGRVLADAAFGAGKKSLNDLLGATSLNAKQRQRFADIALKSQDDGGLLWDLIAADNGIPEAKVQDAKSTFAFGAMSKNHIEFISFAKKALPRKTVAEPGLAAAMSVKEWMDLIQKGVEAGRSVVPDNIDGETQSDRIGAFAQMLQERAENSYPTMAAIGRIKERPDVKLDTQGELAEMISKVPDMNLRTLNINAVRLGRDVPQEETSKAQTLRNTVELVAKLSDEAVVELKQTQRAMRLAPNATAAAALLATGQHSAHLIHHLGKGNFVSVAVKAGMTDLQAGQTFDRAEAGYGYLVARLLEYRQDLDKASPAAVGGAWKSSDLVSEIENDPSLRTLFGSLDSCACDWCESVHGPAAYYTDILRWLGVRLAKSGTGFSSARDVLADRRTDLLDILLNCENTETLMPYIDLTNEVLEEAVSPTGTPRQTTWRAKELMAEPEHVNLGAYALLANASHAPGLPFDLSHAEASTYLAHLRLTRADVMEAFGNEGAGLPAPRDTAAAYFGLSKVQGDIIVTADPGNQGTYWAFTAPGELFPTAPSVSLMARADISYEDLAELLSVEFVNGAAPVSSFQPEFECELFERTVINLSADRLDRMNRFIRLWRQLGWKMWELDRAIMAFGGLLNGAVLVNLMRLDKMRRRFNLSIEEALALVSPLDIRVRDWLTGDGRAFYTDLFQDRAVQNPPDPDLTIAAVTAAPPPALIGDKSAILSASLAMSAEDLNLLAPPVADVAVALPTAGSRASLEALTQIYRYARLAKALRLRVAELLDFVRLVANPLNGAGLIDPFISMQALEEFLERFDQHAASGFSIGETRHAITQWPETVYGATDTQITGNIEEVRTHLADIQAETIVPVEERTAALERQLPGVQGFEDAAIRATAISIINDTYGDTLANRNAFITANFAVLMPVATAIAEFAPFAGPPAAREAAIRARELVALEAIYQVLSHAGITSIIASQTGLDASAAEYLTWILEAPALGPVGGLIQLETDFLTRTADDSAYLLEATAAAMPDIFEPMQLVNKIAFVSETLGWTAARLIWVLQNSGSNGIPDLADLPVSASDSDLLFDDWLTLLRWHNVFNAFPETADISLPIMLDQIGTPGYDIAQLTDDFAVWAQRPVDTVSGAVTELGITYPGEFSTVEAYERLLRALAVMKLADVPAAQLTTWAVAAVSPAVALEIKLAAKAKHTLDAWLEIAPPLQDRLREAKRVALITYLTTRPAAAGPSWPDAAALFAHFLIDPEMSACRKTSRLVQATGSVQLFVQRCLMNLEPNVVADAEVDDAWNQWEWMYAYRLWEAARKVFLWPENVIRPELNRMKSPALLQLEQKLSQIEMTEENAELALGEYLENLDGIANLDILAMHQENNSADRIIHTIARTKGQPQVYYYRQRVFPNNAAAAYWTPWEKLDIDVGGSPVFGYINRKLHLFWLFFTEKPDPTQILPPSTASEQAPPDAIKMWEIQLCWAVRRQGVWQPAQMGQRKWFYPQFRPKRSFHLKTANYAGDRLAINIFVSTSPEFNDNWPLTYFPGYGTIPWPRDQIFLVPILHSEDARPFHIARFVFKRDVDEVQMINRSGFLSNMQAGDYGAEAAETVTMTSVVAELTLPTDMWYVDQSIRNQSDNASNLHVLSSTGPSIRLDDGLLLEDAPAPFRLVPPTQNAQFSSTQPFFYADRERSFFVRPTREWRVDHSFTTEEPSLSGTYNYRVKYTFDRFYHPFSGFFLDELATGGLRGFYKRSTQLSPPSDFAFSSYDPSGLVSADHEDDVVEFGFSGAYSSYNWEAFFHAPFLIANRLSENQRFEEALHFLRYIFDPTNATSEPSPQRYWITKPFFQMGAADYNSSRIERLLELVNSGSATHVAQVEQWRNDPFDPHMLARLRPVAYQRTVVMSYIDTLLGWGDREFRRFTTESLNLATQYYVRALDLLGPRPETVPVDRRAEAKTFREVEGDLDTFGNFLSEVENVLPPPPSGGSGGNEPLPPITLFYFCIPGNDKLLDYWDRVESNLFNLRNCRDISGVKRAMPLFAPPIDPAMLVRAAAAGIDLSTLAGGAASALPKYRFRFIMQRAYSFASEVERLGGAMLQALERRDEAELAELRESHIEDIHTLLSGISELRVDEANAEIDRLKEAKKGVELREKYFKKKVETPINVLEGIGIGLKATSFALKVSAAIMKATGGSVHAIPDFQAGAAGVGGSPTATVKAGGKQVGDAVKTIADGFKIVADLADKGAELSFKVQYFLDRHKKYVNQYEMAEQELVEIEKQLLKAEIAVAISEGERDAENRRIEHARSSLDFLTSRYTNKELYDWLVNQISTVYFQAYQTAFDMALSAAACAEREVGLIGTNYVKFGYWDSLRKGLMSGEKLSQDLRRLEAAYIDRNCRLYEVQKDISVGMLDAEALLTLRATGACEIEVPEMVYDGDYPGHFKRRIKSVAVTIPTVAGPYTSVNCKLTLLRDETRLNTSLTAGYPRTSMTDDDRFADNWAAMNAIVTSKAINDPGVFAVDLEDERYLPFEGAGAVGRWRIELPADTNAFALDTVADVIVHIRYTAEEGGDTLADAARVTASQRPVAQSAKIMRLDQVMGSAWQGLIAPPAGGQDQMMTASFTKENLPYLDRVRDLKVTSIALSALDATSDLVAEISAPGGMTSTITMQPDSDLGNRISGDTGGDFVAGVGLGDFTLKLRTATALDFTSLSATDLAGMYAIFFYDAEQP